MQFVRAAIGVLILLACGCASTSHPPAGSSRTGGVEVEMLVLDVEGGSAALYRVDADGDISFGGGLDARHGRTTWTAAMSDDEIADLLTVMNEYDWLQRRPAGGKRTDDEAEGSKAIHRVHLRSPTARHRFSIEGQREDVQRVREVLHRASLRRLDPVLNTMPKPGVQPRS